MPRLPNLVRLYREGKNDELYAALKSRATVLVRVSQLHPQEWDDAVAQMVEAGFGVVAEASAEGLEGVVALRMRDVVGRLTYNTARRARHEYATDQYPEPTVPGPEEQMVEAVTRAEQMQHATELVKTLFAADWLTPREKEVLHDLYANGEAGAAERLGITAENLRKVRQRIRDKMAERGLE